MGPAVMNRSLALARAIEPRFSAANEAQSPSAVKKALASAVIVGLIGIQAWAIAVGYEDWPLGANTMFAFDVDADSAIYDLVFYAELDDGTLRRVEPSTDLGIPDMFFKRQFFAKYYGSTMGRFPQGWHEGDGPAAFQGRVADWCRRIARVLARHGLRARAVRLMAQRLSLSLQVLDERPVARVILESGAKP